MSKTDKIEDLLFLSTTIKDPPNDSSSKSELNEINGIHTDEIKDKLNSDFANLYSTVNKTEKIEEEEEEEVQDESIIIHVEQHQLPLGWIRCCDDEGSIYYWHKPTGTVQRVPPPVLTQSKQSIKTGDSSNFTSSLASSNRSSVSPTTTPMSNTTTTTTSDFKTSSNSSPSHQINENIFLNMSYREDCKTSKSEKEESSTEDSSASSHCSSSNDLVKFNRRFYVRTLGWVKIAEQDLTAEKSSKAVNKCIHDLSHGFKDYNDVVARWGEGKDLFMDIEDDYLVMVDPIENKVLNKQAITSIRVWGVGRDNGRDFAYVARDKLTKVHQCHVFRCEDVPAKDIANTLRDVCKQIMVRKGLIQKSPKQLRPNLLNELKRQDIAADSSEAVSSNLLPLIKFPTPVDEPKKTINCKYVGSIVVHRPSGMNVLNDAIDNLYINSYKVACPNSGCDNSINEVLLEEILLNKDITIDTVKREWTNVAVTISPSTIYTHKINDDNSSDLIFECRIRYLSFLGIATNVKLFGFFEHCADTSFKCHAYYNEPSSAPLCKTIEAACKLRFQKCLDAHPRDTVNNNNNSTSNQTNNNNSSKGLGTQLKNMFDLIKSRKKR